ncbi:c-type cytochrome [Aliifodinibius sp. S!AR15-10]|uniref:c-type cytochrome n=1 Tax=Aliifodinibius sp. S!AR15-10 TaxID=2950437 RepID=UPI002857C7B5|nr:c-type cytochrome [Aliifodinibius sp. S!AR15-10]MDR8394562.1 c-type cytochrome [Aliifodinibius sp. S!AR15-10]
MSRFKTKMGFGYIILVLIIPLMLIAYDVSETGISKVASGNENAEFTKEDSVTENIQVLPGFEVQMLYEVPREDQGSWVSLAVGPEGNLIASDQEDKGLFKISVGGTLDKPEVNVKEMIMPALGAQGLLWSFDHLYANLNGEGLFRLRDSNGNNQLNIMEYLGGPAERGEHGNHSVIPTEDGNGLYVVNGNHTPSPELTGSRLANWEEDILLPRNWDARGHARGIFAPGGYITRINPEGTTWEMISMGYRNTYDIAVNPHGDLFAYDSDMEWDMGMPWYRPTRLLHAVSGSDYGWRSGSGKWKEYYEDSLPPLVNIGPGSPTGLLFGTGAEFPARYQRALFGLDWTFGTMYAFHLTPKGSSYTAEVEEFLSGSPLPLTDAVVGEDGAMYFTTGGRNQQSYLFRVIYTGNESTSPAEAIDNPEAKKAREIRHKLEAIHGQEDPNAVETAWPYLSNEDRYIRHAARVAIEAQPVEYWAQKAFSEMNPQARITAMVALARTGTKSHRDKAINALLELNAHALDAQEQLGHLRAMSLIFMRLGDPGDELRTRITNRLQELLPNDDARVNTELIRVLVYLKDSRVIGKALTLLQKDTKPSPPDWSENLLKRNERYGGTISEMINNPPPTHKLEYAFMLRNLSEGWTIEQRREYFTFINEAADGMGGASYTGFLERMRDEALANATEEEVEAVSDLTGVSLAQEPDFEINPPEGPGRQWTVDGAMDVMYDDEEGGDRETGEELNFDRGRSLFHAIGCAACHRLGGYGGNIGPDLNSVARRFGVEGVIEKIIDPNILISDQYSSSEVTLKNGDTVTGLVVERGGELKVYTRDPDEPPTVVNRDQVVSIEPVDISQMPPGLINTLNPDELRDLMAYIESGGNPEDEVYVGEEEESESDENEEETSE